MQQLHLQQENGRTANEGRPVLSIRQHSFEHSQFRTGAALKGLYTLHCGRDLASLLFWTGCQKNNEKKRTAYSGKKRCKLWLETKINGGFYVCIPLYLTICLGPAAAVRLGYCGDCRSVQGDTGEYAGDGVSQPVRSQANRHKKSAGRVYAQQGTRRRFAAPVGPFAQPPFPMGPELTDRVGENHRVTG